eukprot:1152018-Amphidinium_carterae.1
MSTRRCTNKLPNASSWYELASGVLGRDSTSLRIIWWAQCDFQSNLIPALKKYPPIVSVKALSTIMADCNSADFYSMYIDILVFWALVPSLGSLREFPDHRCEFFYTHDSCKPGFRNVLGGLYR